MQVVESSIKMLRIVGNHQVQRRRCLHHETSRLSTLPLQIATAPHWRHGFEYEQPTASRQVCGRRLLGRHARSVRHVLHLHGLNHLTQCYSDSEEIQHHQQLRQHNLRRVLAFWNKSSSKLHPLPNHSQSICGSRVSLILSCLLLDLY